MRIRQPLRYVHTSNVLCPYPVLEIEVFSSEISWRTLRFLIDTGCPISIVPKVRGSGLLRFGRGRPLTIKVAGARRLGELTNMRFRFPEQRQHEYTWPVLIADEPVGEAPTRRSNPSSVEDWAERVQGYTLPCLLGTAGFLSHDFDLLLQKDSITLYRRGGWQHRLRQLINRI